jgi:hypothetical protein
MAKSTKYLLSMVISDDGVSYGITEDSEEVSWEDGTRNLLSVGAQYIISKILEDLECFGSDCNGADFKIYFSDRLAELKVLQESKFISPDLGFEFRDERSGAEGDEESYGCPCLEGYREA